MNPSALPETFDVSSIARLGLVAGEGQFPLLIARAARDRGVPVSGFGIRGIASEEFAAAVERMTWIEFGKLQQLFDAMHAEGVTHMTMAGRLKHSLIFQLHRLDARALKLVVGLANGKADTVLGRGTAELEAEGFRVLDSTIFLRSLMPPKGLLTPRVKPSKDVRLDVEFGRDLAKSVAGLDIGQTVVVKNRSIVAVEAMEGTDAAIERAGAIAGEGIVVVKVSKPRQDRRFDVPVIGLTTAKKLVAARAAALAFSGGETLFFDMEAAVALAQDNGIAIVGV